MKHIINVAQSESLNTQELQVKDNTIQVVQPDNASQNVPIISQNLDTTHSIQRFLEEKHMKLAGKQSRENSFYTTDNYRMLFDFLSIISFLAYQETFRKYTAIIHPPDTHLTKNSILFCAGLVKISKKYFKKIVKLNEYKSILII